MKKNLSEEAQRIMQIMESVEGKKIITELNVRYLDQLLDKISSSGMESLSDYEKDALMKLSNNQDVNAPEIHSLGKTDSTLRFTTTDQNHGELLVQPQDAGQTFGKQRLENAYIHGEAADIAGYDLPVFIDGDLTQLDKPKEEQEIRMLTPNGEYEIVSEVTNENGLEVYYLTLKGPEEDDPELDDENFAGLNEDMSIYAVYGDDPNIMKEEKDDEDMRVYNIFDDLEESEGFASQVDADSDQMGDIDEEKPSAGLSAEKKSETVKKAKSGKDIGKKGKNFEKVAEKAAKKYGSKEKGEKVAAASMWKNIKR